MPRINAIIDSVMQSEVGLVGRGGLGRVDHKRIEN